MERIYQLNDWYARPAKLTPFPEILSKFVAGTAFYALVISFLRFSLRILILQAAPTAVRRTSNQGQ